MFCFGGWGSIGRHARRMKANDSGRGAGGMGGLLVRREGCEDKEWSDSSATFTLPSGQRPN